MPDRSVSPAVREEINFRTELAALLNKYSRENVSGTPDHILANHLGRCLDAFDQTMVERETWYGRRVKGGTNISEE